MWSGLQFPDVNAFLNKKKGGNKSGTFPFSDLSKFKLKYFSNGQKLVRIHELLFLKMILNIGNIFKY